jgi:hypothetical protein
MTKKLYICLNKTNKNLEKMTNLFLPLIADVTGNVNDPVNFTFLLGGMALMAASAFFFLAVNQFDKKWRQSV